MGGDLNDCWQRWGMEYERPLDLMASGSAFFVFDNLGPAGGQGPFL